jgi:putative hydrolase of the HAD superfamily
VIIQRPAVVFDLWGTLVPPFPRSHHTAALVRCAAILGLDPQQVHAAWVETFPRRVRGEFPTIASNLELIADQAGVHVHPEKLRDSVEEYTAWTKLHLTSSPGVIATLQALRDSGHRLGLVTNCSPDVPPVLETNPLRELFDVCVYSCLVHAVKPEPAIYQAALDGLGCTAAEAVYVGDGSDNELTGARNVGMDAVLVSADLSDAYDQVRPDHQKWAGPRIPSVSVLVSGLSRPA